MKTRYTLFIYGLISLLALVCLSTGLAQPPGRGGGGGAAKPVMTDNAETPPLRVVIMPSMPRGLGESLVGAWIIKSGNNATAQVIPGRQAQDILKTGKFDVLLGACPDSTQAFTDAGLTIPESDAVLYYGRLAMFLPPADPKHITTAQDLAQTGLRIGLCTTLAKGPLVEKLKAKATMDGSLDKLLDQLEQDKLDVVVGLDTCAPARTKLVTIRLPQAAAGPEAAVAMHGFVIRGTRQFTNAVALVNFCAKENDARNLILSRAILTSDGTNEEDYSKNAAKRMMPAYLSVAQQVAEDYSKGAKNCLDLGCGPGELTLEVAKASGMEMTGLDIEPEGIELAIANAKEAGLDARTHWVAADVHALPFPDNSFDVVMSRGSINFWRDQVTALHEIMRVLKPGGVAFLGGGSGRFMATDTAQRTGAMPNMRGFNFPFRIDNTEALMARAGIADYRHLTEGGSWIEFHKPLADNAKKGE
jgi:ubiquinone/menaquinone biosynthesis C-methylase UbiE